MGGEINIEAELTGEVKIPADGEFTLYGGVIERCRDGLRFGLPHPIARLVRKGNKVTIERVS